MGEEREMEKGDMSILSAFKEYDAPHGIIDISITSGA